MQKKRLSCFCFCFPYIIDYLYHKLTSSIITIMLRKWFVFVSFRFARDIYMVKRKCGVFGLFFFFSYSFFLLFLLLLFFLLFYFFFFSTSSSSLLSSPLFAFNSSIFFPLQLSIFNFQLSTFSFQPSTYNFQPFNLSTFNFQLSTFSSLFIPTYS